MIIKMGILDFLRPPDINSGVARFRETKGAVLLDVRSAEEYGGGHIENSINLPLGEIEAVVNIIKDKNTPIFVHCLSGGRSSKATAILRQMGYTDVTNIGGISAYRGKVVK